MARISGVDIPREKRVEIGLTYLYGIGLASSKRIIKIANVSSDTRVRDLTEDEIGGREWGQTSKGREWGQTSNVEFRILSTFSLNSFLCFICSVIRITSLSTALRLGYVRGLTVDSVTR